MKPAPQWLDRRIAAPGPYLTLCLEEAEFQAVRKRHKLPEVSFIKNDHSNATCHFPQGEGHSSARDAKRAFIGVQRAAKAPKWMSLPA